MTEKNIGISQQTLVSRGGESGAPARKVPQYFAALAATLGAVAAGMALSWTSPTDDGKKLVTEWSIQIDESEFSWISSIINLGAATICVPIGILSDMIGRKKAMLLLTIPFTLAWLLIIFSNSVTMFYIGRYLLGISGGAFCVTAPMYTAEIAENSIRGTLGSFFQLMLTVGILMTYALGSVVSIKVLSIVSGVVPLVFCAVFIIMPETPVYLLKKGNVTAARESYRWLRGPQYNIEPELEQQNEALLEASRNKVSFFTAIQSKAAKKGLLIAFGLMFFQQLSGVNAIIFYAADIFGKAKSEMNKDTQSIIVGVMQVVAVFVSSQIVDRLGRRILLLISNAFMCISTLAIGIFFYFSNSGADVSSYAFVPLVALCLFIVVFSVGAGPIPWLYSAEIFSPQIKGIAGSAACLFNWIMAFLVTKFFKAANTSLGADVTFWIFSGISAIGFVFVYLILPETKGKTLDDIQIELSGGSPTNSNNHSNSRKM